MSKFVFAHNAKKFATGCALVFAVAGLAACSGTHQVIDSGESCSSCHSDEKQTYEVSNPSGAVSSNGSLTVKTSEAQVYVCRVTFISEDGSRYVPMMSSTKQVNGGEVELTLDEGTWALCTVNGSDVKKSSLVVVSASGDASTVVEL